MIENAASRRKLIFFFFVVIIFLTIIKFRQPPSESLEAIKEIQSTQVEHRSACRHVSVDELDQWFESEEWKEIPKIIHQTWKNKTLRERQARWSQTWCDQYPEWRYHLWTDEENDIFVQKRFPWFYSTFKQLSPAILRADSVRYLYMYYYGGFYIDLDYESIRPIDQLFVNKSVVFSLINYSFDSMNSVPNSWMASRPNHPLWTYVSYRIMLLWSRATDKERNEFWNGKAEFFTGPQSLFEGLMFHLHSTKFTDEPLNELFDEAQSQTPDAIHQVDDVTFLGPKFNNAFDWMNGIGADVCSAERATFDEQKCKDTLKPIYAITYWSHSYGHGHENDPNYLASKKT